MNDSQHGGGPGVAGNVTLPAPLAGTGADKHARSGADDIAHGLVLLSRIRLLLVGIFLLMAFTASYFARDVLLPIVFAILITLTLRPVVRLLQRIWLPPPVSAVLLILSIGVGAATAVYFISGPVGNLARSAPQIGAEVRFKLRDVLAQVSALQQMSDEVQNLTSGENAAEDEAEPETPLTAAPRSTPGPEAAAEQEEDEDDRPTAVVVNDGGILPQAVGSVASTGTSMVAALILAMFLLASGDFFHRRIVEATPRLTDKKRALTIVRDVERQISRYLAAITIINAGLGIAVGLALWGLGMPLAYMWGIAAFLLNYLPFLGAVIGIAGVGMVALVTFDSASYALLVPLVYFLLTSLEGQIVTPMMVGRRLELNTSAVFITVVFWIWLWGVPGALMAVPFLVVVKVICDNVESLHPLAGFLSGEPLPTT